jgi:hypothetical protein
MSDQTHFKIGYTNLICFACPHYFKDHFGQDFSYGSAITYVIVPYYGDVLAEEDYVLHQCLHLFFSLTYLLVT